MKVFEETQPLVVSVLDGYNVCIFAYGQTGSGKTHTMQGYGAAAGVNPHALDLCTISFTTSFLSLYYQLYCYLSCYGAAAGVNTRALDLCTVSFTTGLLSLYY
jgi:hypothetical protein